MKILLSASVRRTRRRIASLTPIAIGGYLHREPHERPRPGALMNLSRTISIFGLVALLSWSFGCREEHPLVTSPPTITAQPQGRVVPIGQSWTLSVTATGPGTLRYQWRRSGTAISGADRATYIIAPASLSEGGTFDVVVSNEAGSVTSSPVTVMVVTSQGPWNNGLWIAVSANGKTWATPQPFLGPAGVPSLARADTGRLIAAFQWFPFDRPEAFDKVAVAFSGDHGATWSAPQPIQVKDMPPGYMRPFDPTVVITETGLYRLYFTSNTGSGSNNAFYSAVSTDGVSYVWEPGARFAPGRSTVDCAVAHWNGQWHLVSPIGGPDEGSYHAVSIDGLAFVRLADIPSSGGFNWTGNLVVDGGVMRFFGGGAGGIWFSDTTDGVAWSPPAAVGIQGGDPGVVQTSTGTWIIVYVGPPTGSMDSR